MSWQDVLAEALKEKEEMEAFVSRSRINASTIYRWLSGESLPRPTSVQAILRELPAYREELEASFRQVGLLPPSPAPLPQDVPAVFVWKVVSAIQHTPASLLFWTVARLVLAQALQHLDPARMGLRIALVHCTPPSQGSIVRSLKEVVGIGTEPWESDIGLRNCFHGAESLAGYVVMQCQAAARSREDLSLIPASFLPGEASVGASPLLRCGRVAGCLLVVSTKSDFFTAEKRAIIDQYAALFALASEPEQFYGHTVIQLSPLPSYQQQQRVLAAFQPEHSALFRNTEVSRWQALEAAMLTFRE